MVEASKVDERILRVGMKHTFGFIFFFFRVNGPTEICGTVEKDAFKYKLSSLLDRWSPIRDTLTAFGNLTPVPLLAPIKLATSYVLVPIYLVPGMTAVLVF